MTIQRIVSIYTDLLSDIQGLVYCTVTAGFITFHFNKHAKTIFISIYHQSKQTHDLLIRKNGFPISNRFNDTVIETLCIVLAQVQKTHDFWPCTDNLTL